MIKKLQSKRKQREQDREEERKRISYIVIQEQNLEENGIFIPPELLHFQNAADTLSSRAVGFPESYVLQHIRCEMWRLALCGAEALNRLSTLDS